MKHGRSWCCTPPHTSPLFETSLLNFHAALRASSSRCSCSVKSAPGSSWVAAKLFRPHCSWSDRPQGPRIRESEGQRAEVPELQIESAQVKKAKVSLENGRTTHDLQVGKQKNHKTRNTYHDVTLSKMLRFKTLRTRNWFNQKDARTNEQNKNNSETRTSTNVNMPK